jgi:predicted alpha/beta hydrolase family esterase
MSLAWLLRLVAASLALSASLWLGWCWSLGNPLLGWAGALAIGGIHVPLLALEFAWLRHAQRGTAVRASRRDLLRAFCAEAVGSLVVFGWRLPYRSKRYADQLPAESCGRRGLILLHGFICNRGVWNPWWPRLLEQRVPCLALNLQPMFGSIDSHAPAIEAAVRRMHDATGRAPLLVAHSMGALAARAWLRDFDGDSRIYRLISVGAPHHGTRLARFGLSINARQMRFESRWIRELAAHETAQRRARVTCFYSLCDNVVQPTDRATLAGADNRPLSGFAHVHLLQHPAVIDEVMRCLHDWTGG